MVSFIRDGDSSVYSTLISSILWGYAITKIECANHCVKCYRTALEKLAQDKPSCKGRGKLTEAMRKWLIRAAWCTIIMRSKETNQQKAIVNLRKDLLNGLLHCFGFHSKWSIDFCKTPQHQSLPAPPSTSLQSAENTSTSNSTLPQHTTPANLPDDKPCLNLSSTTLLQTADLDDLDNAISDENKLNLE